MKSKTYILKQIKDLLIDNKAYSERRADQYIENVKDNTVYELLVIKKDLASQLKEHADVSCMRSLQYDCTQDD
jgi:hypothetical protein